MADEPSIELAPSKSPRQMLDEALAKARSIEMKLDQLSVEWTSAKHILEEDLKTLKHDQSSLRTVLNALLDELEQADAAKAAKVSKTTKK